MSSTYDVTIVGAGPVGLYLACELGLAGVSVLVLEKDSSPDSIWKRGFHGERGMHITSVEAFYRRGLLDKVLRTIPVPGHIKQIPGTDIHVAGHFAGIRLDVKNVDSSKLRHHIPLPIPENGIKLFYPAATTTPLVENNLAERAEQLGVHILRGQDVTKVEQAAETVTVHTATDSFGSRWLVGCDGGESKVREAAGFDFPGTPAQFRGYMVDCEMENEHVLKHGFNRTRSGVYIHPEPGHIVLSDYETLGDHDEDAPLTAETFQEVLRRVSETDVIVNKIRQGQNFTNQFRQVPDYRKGRVILCGDSARITPPFGAQGLSMGLGDASNLGWKLASTIKGTAPANLLDTYNTERHAEGARHLEWAIAQGFLLKMDRFGHAVASILNSLAQTPGGANYFFESIVGLKKQYHFDGPQHPLVGYSAPDFHFADGTRLGSKMSKGQFIVVDFCASQDVEEFVRAAGAMVCYATPSSDAGLNVQSMVIRPDGVVSWASETPATVDQVQDALFQWLDLPQGKQEDSDESASVEEIVISTKTMDVGASPLATQPAVIV